MKSKMDPSLWPSSTLLLLPPQPRGTTQPFSRENVGTAAVKARWEEESEAQHPCRSSLSELCLNQIPKGSC